jgi:hypothetical protein
MELFWVIKMLLNETCSEVRIFLILFRMAWNKEMLYDRCFKVRKSKKTEGLEPNEIQILVYADDVNTLK